MTINSCGERGSPQQCEGVQWWCCRRCCSPTAIMGRVQGQCKVAITHALHQSRWGWPLWTYSRGLLTATSVPPASYARAPRGAAAARSSTASAPVAARARGGAIGDGHTQAAALLWSRKSRRRRVSGAAVSVLPGAGAAWTLRARTRAGVSSSRVYASPVLRCSLGRLRSHRPRRRRSSQRREPQKRRRSAGLRCCTARTSNLRCCGTHLRSDDDSKEGLLGVGNGWRC